MNESSFGSPGLQDSEANIQPSQERFQALRPERNDILAQFTHEQQREIEEKRRTLSSLAYFIGKDFRIPVELNEPGAGWHWDFKANIIRIDPKDLLEKPMDYLRFVISHEGGHRRITRADFIPLETWSQPGFSFMMNAIEDPRMNNFVAEAYPKFKEQMKLAYETDLGTETKAQQAAEEKVGYQPRFIQAGFEYIRQWFRETQGQEIELTADLPPEVREVVEKTLASAQDSWWRYPSRQEADQGEEIITRYARTSYEINLEEVWPEFQKLVEKDMEDQKVQEMLEQMQQEQGEDGGPSLPQELKDRLSEELQEELLEALKKAMQEAKDQQGEKQEGEQGAGEGTPSGEPSDQEGAKGKPVALGELTDALKQGIKEYLDSLPPEEQDKLAAKALATLKELEEVINEELGGKLTETPEQRPETLEGSETPSEEVATDPEEALRQAEELNRYREAIERKLKENENVYEQYRREVLPIIDELEQDLREIFVQRRAQRWQSGFRSGKRIDIKRRIQEKVKGVSPMQSKSWERRELPKEKDYAITLLNDLSGSMQGEKIQEDFKAKIVFSEVLNRLSIPTEILGFNDRIHEYQPFGQQMNPDIRKKMGNMLTEVNTSRANWNDDGWAVQQASERLERQEASEKFLIVLSDGEPVESSKHPASEFELGKIVKKVMEDTNQKVIGIGIGPGTSHVEHYYPNSISDVRVAEMASKVADIIREVIANYDQF